MKYYIGEVMEQNGDLEYRDKFLFATKGSAEKHAWKVAKDWRGSTKGDWAKNGENTFGRRRAGLNPETPVRKVEGKDKK